MASRSENLVHIRDYNMSEDFRSLPEKDKENFFNGGAPIYKKLPTQTEKGEVKGYTKPPAGKGFLNQPLNVNAPNAPEAPKVEAKEAPNVKVKPGEKLQGRIDKLQKVKKKSVKIGSAFTPSFKDLPTPPTGGIGLLLFMALLTVFAITPTSSGQTRLQLVWGAILGTYSYSGSNGDPTGTPNTKVKKSTVKKAAAPAPVQVGPNTYIQGVIGV